MILLFASMLMAPAAPPAEHAVILIIDGLSYKAVDRLDLKNFRKLIAAGTYYEKSYNILPATRRAASGSSIIPLPFPIQ